MHACAVVDTSGGTIMRRAKAAAGSARSVIEVTGRRLARYTAPTGGHRVRTCAWWSASIRFEREGEERFTRWIGDPRGWREPAGGPSREAQARKSPVIAGLQSTDNTVRRCDMRDRAASALWWRGFGSSRSTRSPRQPARAVADVDHAPAFRGARNCEVFDRTP